MSKSLPTLLMLCLASCGAAQGDDTPVERAAVQVGTPQSGAPVTARPRLVFEAREVDFGKVPDQAVLRGKFPFENGGDAALTIAEVKPSCGCTTTTLEKLLYAPREKGEIEIEWETKGHGPQSKTIVVRSDDPVEPVVTLTIRAQITPFLSTEPARVEFGNVRNGERSEVLVEITCVDPEFRIEALRSPAAGLSATLLEGPHEGRATIKVVMQTGTPGAGLRRLFPTLQIDTFGKAPDESEPRSRTHDLATWVVLYDELVPEPPFFSVGQVRPGSRFRQEVVLVRPSGGPFQILAAEAVGAAFTDISVTTSAIEPDRWRLVLEGGPGSYEGPLNGRVMVTTDVKEDSTMAIDFMGVVRP